MKDVTRLVTICIGVVLMAVLLVAGGTPERDQGKSAASALAAIRADLGLRADADVRLATVSHQSRDRKGVTPEAFDLDVSGDDGSAYRLELRRHSNRAPDMFVRVYGADGTYEDRDPGPVRTYRGEIIDDVTGEVVGDVAGSIGRDGELRARLLLPSPSRRAAGGNSSGSELALEELWIEPLRADRDVAHIAFRTSDIRGDRRTSCSVDDIESSVNHASRVSMPEPGTSSLPVHVAEIAFDTDVEFYQDLGEDVEALVDYVEAITNLVNTQYEHQAQITHHVTAIVIRTEEPDPYGSSASLVALTAEWFLNQQDIRRDVVELLTGASGASGVANIASVCDPGRAYCVVPNNGPTGPVVGFGLANTSRHELGHTWGAFHCSCPSHTMACCGLGSLGFTDETISTIIAYRDSIDCLEVRGDHVFGRTDLPLQDHFIGRALDADRWIVISGGLIAADAAAEDLSVLEVSDGGITSAMMDSTEFWGVDISYSYRSVDGMGELVVEYLSEAYEWKSVGQHEGTTSSGDEFARRDVRVFDDILTDELRIRVRASGTARWHVDDLSIKPVPFNPCPEDCVTDGVIDIDDLMTVIFHVSIGSLGCDVAPKFEDGSFGNGAVNFDDIIAVLSAFGPCDE